MAAFGFLIFVSVFLELEALQQGTVLVNTKHGAIRGISEIVPYSNGTVINKFLGVPYASPPVGTLRFEKPQPLSPWTPVVYNATRFQNICMQLPALYGESIKLAWPKFSKEFISEDCLYLNIYTPSNASTASKSYPVLVHIHGGSFLAGTPVRVVSPGEYLPLRGVILVGVQYRLGPFGFLATEDSLVPGNNGMLDQVAALRWVKENIARFGGDPNRITLLGESAGGASVSLHLLSPLSIGLFHQGIIESGVDFCPFAFLQKSHVVKATKDLAQKLKCAPNESDREMLECLRSRDAWNVVEAAAWLGNFIPTTDDNFLHDTPGRLRNAGKFQHVPLIAGFVSHEGAQMINQNLKFDAAVFRREIERFLRETVKIDKAAHELVANALEFQYTPWPDTSHPLKLRQRILDMYSDYFITAPTHAVSIFQSQLKPVYMFEFSHRSKHQTSPEWKGTQHGDNTAYNFGAPLLNLIAPHNFSDADRVISDMVVTLYTNFVKFGKPTPQPVHGVTWIKFNSTNRAYLRIRKNPEMAVDFHPRRLAFWNRYFPKLLKESVQPTRSTPALPVLCTSAADSLMCTSIISFFMAAILLHYFIFWKE